MKLEIAIAPGSKKIKYKMRKCVALLIVFLPVVTILSKAYIAQGSVNYPAFGGHHEYYSLIGPDYLKNRIFNIVLVSETNGIGAMTGKTKKEIKYTGKNLVIMINQ